MESSSTIHRSPSFNTIPSHNITDEDEHEFEFPIMCGYSISRQISINESESVSDDQISPRYPLFDQSLLLNDDVNVNLCTNAVNATITEFQPPPSTRSSRLKLFNEDLETSLSESDDLDGVTPGTYCVWKPKTDPDPKRRGKQSKHKKSSSVSIGNTSNRWKVRDLLKWSYSDDGYCAKKESPVLLFIPPVSPNQKKIGKTGSKMTERNIPAYKLKVGNVCYSPYLPYREDQLAAYANFTGGSKNA